MATTFQTYPAPPTNFAPYTSYRTPPATPPPNLGGYGYYSPRNYVHPSTTPSAKGHARRASGDPTAYSYSFSTNTTPRERRPAEYAADYGYYSSSQATPLRNKSEFVSGSERNRERMRYYYRVPAEGIPPRQPHQQQRKYSSSSSKHYSSRTRYVDVHNDYDHERSFEYLPRYEQYEPRPPPYKPHQSYYESRADHRYRDQVPIYTPADSSGSNNNTSSKQYHSQRPRRASYTTKTTNPPPRPRPNSSSAKPPAKATEDDARRAGIPAGYSYKNWDPTEEPILLLGSVFDANSLGKWIYDWTVFFYGPATPMSEVAGELWLLLIQLAHKVRRAEETMPRIRATKSRDMVDDFLESGERLWQRFNKLLKICENYMWKAAKKECGNAKNVTMGKNSGCEFVDSIFGRHRELERTEKLMTGMRLWSMRFDANCEDILRNPAE